MAGNYVLMMSHTVVAGWLACFFIRTAAGGFIGLDTDGVNQVFIQMQQNAPLVILCTAFVVVSCFGICAMGLQNGVERITKVMMLLLLFLILALAVRSLFLEGGEEGLKFYLSPNLDAIREYGLQEVLFAAMGQAFFTLKRHSLF